MTMPPATASSTRLRTAVRDIRLADPAFIPIIDVAGPCSLGSVGDEDRTPFVSLVGSIVSQQLSTAAAATIHQRLTLACGSEITPQAIQGLGDDALRGAGLSGAKCRTLRELATRICDGTLDLEALRDEGTDEDITTELTSIWGIGEWTVHMFLIFHLGRWDIWPAGDLGVRKGWQVVHGGEGDPGPTALQAAADHLRPHRSVAAWYCWRAWEKQTELRSQAG